MNAADVRPYFAWLAVLLGAAPVLAAQQDAGTLEAGAAATQFMGNVFVENRGQWPDDTLFMGRFDDGITIRAERHGILLQGISHGEHGVRGANVRLEFEGSGAAPRVAGTAPQPAVFNFFTGIDASGWRNHVSSFAGVDYDFDDGARFALSSVGGRLQFDVLLASDASLAPISMHCEGSSGLDRAIDGTLRIGSGAGPLTLSVPRVWQVLPSGGRCPVPSAFRVIDGERFGFEPAGEQPAASALSSSADPWATFLGGSGADEAFEARVMPSGAVLVLGHTDSQDFPTTPGAFQSTTTDWDCFVTCLDSSGSSLVFSTLLGGAASDRAEAMAVAADGRIAVGGWTQSSDFPITSGGYSTNFNGGVNDAFFSELSVDGADLLYSTFFGGTCQEGLVGIAYDIRGRIIAVGGGCSMNIPVTPGAYDTTHNGGTDCFAFVLDPALGGSAQLVSSTFLGGSSSDTPFKVAFTEADEPIITGIPNSTNFPVTPGALDPTPGGWFISRLSADLSRLEASTYFKLGHALRVAWDGQVLVAGQTTNADFPTATSGFDGSYGGMKDAFVAKLDPDLTQVTAATYLGGSSEDGVGALAVDGSTGRILAGGATRSSNFPTTPHAFDTSFSGGCSDPWFASLSSDLSELVYGSFIGPSRSLCSGTTGVSSDGVGGALIVGKGALDGFPVTPGAYDTTYNGGSLFVTDAFVVHLPLGSPWQNLGGNLAGSDGIPMLTGSGTLAPNDPVTLTLTQALHGGTATLVIGFDVLQVPFKGGILVPTPDVLIVGLPLDGAGNLELSASWPPGIPAGTTVVFQDWIQDPAGPKGFAASNGLSAVSP